MRVLVTTSALEGHYFPMVPLAWALRSFGHEVLVSAPEGFSDAIARTGLSAAGFAPPVEFDRFMLHDREGRPLAPPRDPRDRKEHGGRAWGRLAALLLDRTLDLVEAFRPDLVICEPNDFAGPLAAARHGVPWVEHGWGIMGMPEFRPFVELELAPELARLGLPALPDPDLRIDTCPPGLRTGPEPEGLPMRYVPYNGTGSAPDWVFTERARPRVFVTLGGVLPRHGRRDFRGMLREWTEALPSLGVEVVVGVADDLTGMWRPLPDGVRAAGWFPLGLVLPNCDLVVHHGGVGSTMTTALAGLPQLITPQLVDQFENARRIVGVKAGLSLQPDELSTENVLDRCRELLADDSFAARAREIAAGNAEQPTPAELAGELERFAIRG
ncbi:nucleotide disphospho-sugar-binding domain-containing protein [Kitasatospora sp. NPDC058190]|uniref:nucleotide disphospho-sugar-binding domain-containing protein n=1 Tax=Kitasatospora sp. NPDC058190 TaxID=3346371 RepID=UPI0036DC7BA0